MSDSSNKTVRKDESSEESIRFQSAITKGSWLNLLSVYGPAVKVNPDCMSKYNLDLYDARGMTAIHAACIIEDKDLVISLMKLGATTTLSTLRGWSIWHLAARNPRMMLAMMDFINPAQS